MSLPFFIMFKPGGKLNRDFILSRIREEDIFERYLGIEPSFSDSYINPLRADEKPGCKFYRGGDGRLRFLDFSRGIRYDCFDVVMQKERINYNQALIKIASDFGIGGSSKDVFLPAKNREATEPSKISVVYRELNQIELNYWKQYEVNEKRLNYFRVYGIISFTITKGGVRSYGYDAKRTPELCFAYYIGYGYWQIYFPERETNRFYKSGPKFLMGIDLLPNKGEKLLYTKSYKDIICASLFKIRAVAPPSENILPDDGQMLWCLKRYNRHFALYDNDIAGKRGLIKLKKEYDYMKPILFPPGFEKDLSDNVKRFGTDYLIKQFKNNEILDHYFNDVTTRW